MSENKKMEREFERKRLFEEFKYNKELEVIEDDVNNGRISSVDADELKEAAHNTFTKNMECINGRKKICEEFNRLNEIRIKKSEEPDTNKSEKLDDITQSYIDTTKGRLSDIMNKIMSSDTIKNDNVLKSINTTYTIDLIKDSFAKRISDEKTAYDKQIMMIDHGVTINVLSSDDAERNKRDACEFF